MIFCWFLFKLTALSQPTNNCKFCGIYESKYSSITIMPNHTFSCLFAAGHLEGHSSGYWAINKDTLIFESDYRSDDIKISVKEEYRKSVPKNQTLFYIYGGPFDSYIVLNGKLSKLSENRVSIYKAIAVKKSQIKYFQFYTPVLLSKPYYPQKRKTNVFFITVYLPTDAYRYFDREKWLLKGNCIFLINKEDTYFEIENQGLCKE